MAQPRVVRLLMARLLARPGLEGSVGRELRRFMDAQRRDSGCLSVELHVSRDDPRAFLVVERLECPAELDARAQQPLGAVLRLWSDGLLAASPELSMWEELAPAESRRPPGEPLPATPAPQPDTAGPGPRPPAAPVGLALFTPARLGGLHIGSRLVRSATWEGMAAEDGSATPSLCDLYAQLAGSGLGLVISGNAFISPLGRNRPWQLGVHDDALLPGLRRLAQAAQQGGCRAVLQISHAGCNTHVGAPGQGAKGPSPGQSDRGGPCQAMTLAEIRQAGLDFAKAAVRARQAGFDGVQLHAAHGYLLSQFLSPAYNQRQDGYGGSLENRSRLLLEAAQLARDAVGDEFPVLVKLNAEDFVEKGLTAAEALEVGRRLAAIGVDAVELSGGTPRSGALGPLRKGRIADPARQVYYRPYAARFRAETGLPLILTGGVRDVQAAEGLLADGLADAVGLCRPLIREPGLAARWRAGDMAPARCVSCNRCVDAAAAGKGLYCVLDAEGLEDEGAY